MTRVVLAPNAFKGSLRACEVAAHLADGLRQERPGAQVVVVPVADGGDGLLDVALDAGFTRVPAVADGPLGAPGPTAWAVRGDEAVVEMAAVCGLARLGDAPPAPLDATSAGLGQVLALALDHPVRRVLLGIGGSASTDGGAGMLTALGARLLDRDGRAIPPGGRGLLDLHEIDLNGLHAALARTELTVACDVDNPLTGPRGAAAVYGPQKGAGPQEVALLEAGLTRLAEVLAAVTGTDRRDAPGAGAAGGVGLAALACLGARLRPGTQVVLELVGLAGALAGADLAVTGEGCLDEQTLSGKAPAGVAAAARAAGVPVAAVAGRCELDATRLHAAGIGTALALEDLATRPGESFDDPGPLLREAGRRIARLLPGAPCP